MKCFLVILLVSTALFSYAQVETDRPNFTNSPNLVPKGALQIETGFILETNKISDPSTASYTERNLTLNTTLLRFGLTKYIELRAKFEILQQNKQDIKDINPFCDLHPSFLEQQTGLSSSFLGFKTNLLESDKISIGFLGHLYIPEFTAGDFLAPDGSNVAPEFLIPCSIDLTDKLGIAFQYGLTWDGLIPNPTTSYTFAISCGITDKLGAYLEPYGFLTTNGDELHLINGGFTYLVNDNIQLDLTGGVGLNEIAPDNFINAGASFLLFDK